MKMTNNASRKGLTGYASMAVIALALGHSASAVAQEAPAAQQSDSAAQQDEEGDILVTGSRIAREGFDQPSPTTVIGEAELRQAARANIAQVLNDAPQFRPTVSPAVSVGNTSSGTAPVDLRGLGTARTLTLLNGRRFVGDGNLNLIPSGLVKRVEVVTGGASAAYGSNAVAGVVNILLDTDYEGLTLGGNAGVSSRGDAGRYTLEAKGGIEFAGAAGRIVGGVEYVKDQGIVDRNTRPNLGSAGFVRVNPTLATDLRTRLVRDVNYTNRSADGVVTAGALAGLTFNRDGTTRPFRGPDALGVGGVDGIGLYDDVYAATPFERVNGYVRASYDIGDATLYAEGLYGNAKSNYPFFPDLLLATQTINATNPFVRQEVRNQLAAAGQTSFTVGRVFNDIFPNLFDLERKNIEGAIGVEGSIGSWRYNAHASYGTVESNERTTGTRIAARYTRAVDAVANGAGQPVCAVNADAITTNDDPACYPLNILGNGAADPRALAYVQGTQSQRVLNKLISFGFELQGDLIQLPAGALTVAGGIEGRKEEQSTLRDPLTRTPGYFAFPVYSQDFSGEFSVKEIFGEVAVPVFNAERTAKLDLNGAARYSDFSTSGGSTTWKVGGTLRLFEDLLLRATRSRDIRSPSIGNLFGVRGTNIGALNDQDRAGRTATPGYNPAPSQVFTYSGGNPDLEQERANTLVLGGSYSPSFIPGLSFSVDYYDIKIDGAITTLTGSQLTLACANGNQAACDRVIRDSTGTVTTVFANAQNVASFATSGLDIEASYVLPLSNINAGWNGELRLRALANYVEKFVTNDGTLAVDRVGSVGNTAAGVPQWRGTFSASYQTDNFGLDARVRYVDGGLFDTLSVVTTTAGVTSGLVNNAVASRTYVDIGAQFKVTDRFTFFGNINNLFDIDPPLSTAGPVHYDAVGTYFLFGARANF